MHKKTNNFVKFAHNFQKRERQLTIIAPPDNLIKYYDIIKYSNITKKLFTLLNKEIAFHP
jgi:hypothetical protein